ncbi:MAG: hypothetical protein JXR83_03145 [Deltaproteobacteria bacterium]|nr:hypothetical protein [Deltaproteobacteria bacterium]
MMLPKHRTDVLVIGGELAGLAAAAVLVKRGLRVVVIGHREFEGWLTVGHALVGELPFVVADFDAPSAVHRVIEELGMRQDVRRLMPFASPPLQLIDCSHRLDLNEDEDLRRRELRREFGRAGDELADRLRAAGERLSETAAWLERVPPQCEIGFFARRRFNRFLNAAAGRVLESGLWDGLDAGHPLARWLRGLIPFTVHVDGANATPMLCEQAAASALSGTRTAPGGERARLFQFARSFCGSHGAEVLPEATVARVDLSHKTEVAVEIAGERTERVASFAIDASRGAWLGPLVEPARAQRGYLDDRAQITRGAVVESRHFSFKPDALPEGIAGKSLVLSDGGEVVLVCVDRTPRPAAGDRSILEGQVAVSASVVVSEAGRPETQQMLRQTVLDLMPFAESLVLAEVSGAATARPLYQVRDDGISAELGPFRPVATIHPRLFRVGTDVMPAWGLDGEFRSALHVVEHIEKQLAGKNPRPETAARVQPY